MRKHRHYLNLKFTLKYSRIQLILKQESSLKMFLKILLISSTQANKHFLLFITIMDEWKEFL